MLLKLITGTDILENNDDNKQHKKNNSKHNEGILGEIRNRIMKEIWSIITSALIVASTVAIAHNCITNLL